MEKSNILAHLHVFQRHGLWLALDTSSFALLNLDGKMGPIVNLKRQGSDVEEIARTLGLPLEEVTTILADLERNLSEFQQSRIPSTPELQPRTLILLVTQTCNLRCRYCYADAGTYSMEGQAILPWSLAKKAVDLAHTLGIGSVQFFGGEPLLAFDLIKQIIAYCQEQKYTFQFGINTNGTRIDSEIAEFFARHNVTVTVSIDGPAEVHDLCRHLPNGAGSLEATLAGVKQLQTHNVPVHLQPVYSKRYIPHASIKEIGTFLRQFSPYFDLGFVTPVGNTVSLADILTEDEVSVLLHDAVDLVFDSIKNNAPIIEGNIYSIISSLFQETLQPKQYVCDGLARRLTVFTNGDIYTCHYTREPANCLGNINEITPEALSQNRSQVLKSFGITLLDFWTDKFAGYCLGTLEKDNDGQFRPRYQKATTEFYEHLLYRIATTDMSHFMENLNTFLTTGPSEH